ncbi:hypothetical protein HHUSO_G1756 [Huso huso]|uniref:Uncharacterized protein n=1 Tax=Huso huso TaxID=61971 RepID=A0ABR1A786_HUSHU
MSHEKFNKDPGTDSAPVDDISTQCRSPAKTYHRAEAAGKKAPHFQLKPLDLKAPHFLLKPLDSKAPHFQLKQLVSKAPHFQLKPLDSKAAHFQLKPLDSKAPHFQLKPLDSKAPHFQQKPLDSKESGQLGHGETTTFLSKPQLLCSELLKGAIRKIDAGDCYSSALTANGELFMWGRNCHVIDGNQPASHKFWSPQKADVSNQAVCDISCGSWHTMILTGIPKGRSPGNKESDFRETGASFKDDSNYPQLIELLPKENSSRKHTGDLQAPPNQAEVLLHSQSSQPSSQPKNSPFDGMDQTDLNRKNHSDGTTVQDASALSAKEKQGNSCSSIKLQEENVRVLIPRGKWFRNRQAFSCLRSPLIPDCLCSGDADYPNTLPEMRRKPKCRSRPQTAGSPWTSSRQPGNGDSSSSTNFSKVSHQSGRIPGREPGCALHPRVRPEGQESGPRHGSRPRTAHPHLSPLASHSTASSSVIVTLNPSGRLAGRPVYQQAIYSSGTAWKHISRSPDPVLSQKRPASETIQQSSQK